ncbi:hypothetical protein EDD17DRAFT_1759034 [Pisolithus thermaeus]|nr:hypothetical protein EDD17DRAFT_1759034 [Pisolithus thermaeus]
MPAIVTLADETARLVKYTSYDLCHALCKVNDLCHAPAPTISAPITVEQAAHDFEWAHIASLGGGTYDPSQEAGPSQVDPPLAIPSPSSLRGRIQAKPASQVEPVGKGKAKAPSTDDQVAPDFSMEDEITSTGIYDDIPMVIDTAVQGTLFPEFTGCENLYMLEIESPLCDIYFERTLRVLFGTVPSVVESLPRLPTAFFNNIEYSALDKARMVDERLGAALANICQGTPPPVPTRRHLAGPVTRWDRGIMGPIGLINTVEDIYKLYTQAYDEPEEKAPCIHRAQDLVTYINLWKKCKLEMNEVMNLVLREWRPPAWASQKSCQKRELKTLGPPKPPLLIKDPLLGVNLFIPEEEHDPLVERQEGVSPNYPKRHPLSMPQSSTGMFPGVLGISECPNDDEWEIGPPSAQIVQGFLLYEQLAPVPRRDHD